MRRTTIGLDIAKSVFQVHGIDDKGKVVIQKQLKRVAVLTFFRKIRKCLIGIEACNTSNYWARELRALGHEVKLLPAQYVKAYVSPRWGTRRAGSTLKLTGHSHCALLG